MKGEPDDLSWDIPGSSGRWLYVGLGQLSPSPWYIRARTEVLTLCPESYEYAAGVASIDEVILR